MNNAWGRLAAVGLAASVGWAVAATDAPKAADPVALQPGPHLLVDDWLIETATNLTRQVRQPERDLTRPVVTGKEDKNFTNRVSVLRDARTGRFRLWYNAQTDPPTTDTALLGYLESKDGITWERPHRTLADPDRRVAPAADPKSLPTNMVANVFDEEPDYPDRQTRFKYAWFNRTGLQFAGSPDGLTWKQLPPGVVLEHNHDINYVFRDPLRNRYVALVSSLAVGEQLPDKPFTGRRRVIQTSVSADLTNWTKPRYAILPNDKTDEGKTEFYCVGGVLARGDLLVGLVRVLRGDLPADPGGPVRGIGYTTLAWSRDGETWTWDREKFLDRSPQKDAWDHAMAWGSCQLPVGDEVYLYYGEYANGHKVNRFTERQIGLVRLPRDRYVARVAGEKPGTLRSRLLTLTGRSLTLNVAAKGGEVRTQIVDVDGKPIPGFTFTDAVPIRADAVAAPVTWKKALSELRGKPVRLEWQLRNAELFAFDIQP